MCDRTGFVNNPKGFLFSAPEHFPKYISEAETIDILILWIGTNDLQFLYNIDLSTIEQGLGNLIKLAKTKAKKIIIISPVILSEKIVEGAFNYQFDKTSIVKSNEVGILYQNLAQIYNCIYFDVNKFVKPSDIDGLHYDEHSHKIIAENLAQLF